MAVDVLCEVDGREVSGAGHKRIGRHPKSGTIKWSLLYGSALCFNDYTFVCTEFSTSLVHSKDEKKSQGGIMVKKKRKQPQHEAP